MLNLAEGSVSIAQKLKKRPPELLFTFLLGVNSRACTFLLLPEKEVRSVLQLLLEYF